jgi:hypothetical protein
MAITPLLALPSPTDPGFEAAIEDRLQAEVVFSQELNALQADITSKYNAVMSDASAAGGIAVAVSTAAAAAAAAAVSKDQAVAAWGAAMAPAEVLPTLSQSMHIGTIVASCIDLPYRHSDSGAWTDRCQGLSWYTETLGGDRWLGQQATIAAAWTAAGSATGAVFQASATAGPLTIGKFYAAASATTATEVTRGIRPDYPKSGVAWVIESARVVGYDIGTVGCPMWMVFTAGMANALYGTTQSSSISALDGLVLVGNSNAGLTTLSFIADSAFARGSSYVRSFLGRLASRNSALGYSHGTSGLIVNEAVNAVAVTVLDNAPIDSATGLPVPTIYAFTAGGVSRIAHDGTVSSTASLTVVKGAVSGSLVRGFTGSVSASWPITATLPAGNAANRLDIAGWTAATYSITTTPASLGNISDGSRDTFSSSLGITKIKENPTTPSKGMTAHINNAYNSGWMVGDTKGAYLADTVAESIAASDIGWPSQSLVVGSFIAATGWDITDLGDRIRITRNAAAYGGTPSLRSAAYVAGRSYVFTFSILTVSASANAFYTATSGGGAQLVSSMYPGGAVSPILYATPVAAGTGTVHWSFAAARSSSTASALNGDYIEVSKTFSIRLSESDRSVKGAGLVINGTLTKAAVASGANLVAYSGFSAANYIQQAYSANHDYGTTGFGGMFWLNQSANTATEYILCRDSPTMAQAIRLWVSTAGFLVFEVSDGTTTRTATGTVAVDDGAWKLVEFDYSGGTLNLYVNSVLYATATGAALLTLNNALATLALGLKSNGTASPLTNGSLALFRMSATIPSADQIAHIYRTELPLFQANAQCTLAGTSPAVTALTHDDTTDLLHVGTSWGRSGFRDLLRVDSEATTTGALTSISASGGTVITCGTSAKAYVPALKLRDELRRKEVATKALGQVPVFFEFDAASFTSPTTSGSAALTASSIVGTPYVGMGITGTGIPAGTTLIAINGTAYTMSANATVTNAGAVALAQSSFTLQQGYTAKAVYSAEALKREGATKTYVRANDGFREAINFATSPGSAVWVSILAVRA